MSLIDDHYALAAFALFGTYAAVAGVLWLVHRSRLAAVIHSFRGLSPPFLSVVGVLFALNLAFLANDTWNAHDRARDAIHQEAGALRALAAAAAVLAGPDGNRVAAALDGYVRRVVDDEWPQLARRGSSPAADRALNDILAAVATAEGAVAAALKPSMLQALQNIRSVRGIRVALSQTHVNPLKWLGMAFLGLVTIIAIVMVHIDLPRAGFLAVMVFATASVPTAVIVLVQGNPFQPPTTVTVTPIAEVSEPLNHQSTE